MIQCVFILVMGSETTSRSCFLEKRIDIYFRSTNVLIEAYSMMSPDMKFQDDVVVVGVTCKVFG